MGGGHSLPMTIVDGFDVKNQIDSKNFLKSTVIPYMRTVARHGKGKLRGIWI